MEIVLPVIGVGIGVAIGFFLGSIPEKKARHDAESKLVEAKKRLAALRKERQSTLEAEKEKAQKNLEKLAGVQEEAGKLQQQLKAYHEKLQQYGGALEAAEKAQGTAAEAAAAHKMARQQAEGRCRQAEQMLSEAQQQIKDMGYQLEQARVDAESLVQTKKRQTKELQRLRADVSSAKGSSSGLDESLEAFAEVDGTLEGVLNVLLDIEGQTTAVVADANGIIVAAVGDKNINENMAATTTMVRTAIKQLEGMVPFEDLRSYTLQDGEMNVLSGRFFHCAGEDVGLATFGPRIPSDRVLDGAMANLSSILE